MARCADDTGNQKMSLDSIRRYFDAQIVEAQALAERVAHDSTTLRIIATAAAHGRDHPGVRDEPAAIEHRLQALG